MLKTFAKIPTSASNPLNDSPGFMAVSYYSRLYTLNNLKPCSNFTGRGGGGMWDKIKTTRKDEGARGSELKPPCKKPKNIAGIRITICITTWGFPALNAISVEATTQRVNLSTPPVKSSPDIREHWKDLKGIGSVFLSPHWCNNAQATVWTWSVLSVSNHVCPTDWMSCICGGRGEPPDFVLHNF